MRRFAAVSALLVLAFVAVRASAQDANPEVIYGDDDRLDIYQVKSAKLLEMADATVSLWPASKVSVDSAKATAKLETESFGESMNMCKSEPYWDQPLGAFCSGSLVGPDLIMTAGHCVTSESDCKETKFVFGFGIKEAGKYPNSVAASDVYGCGQLLGRLQENSGADWALIRTDRPVAGHVPLGVARGPELKAGEKVFVIGHPAGLPTKVAGGAAVRDPSPNGYFVANLDTYGGNSGSAVFNTVTGKVEGILVRGEQDYVWQGNCRVSKKCSNDGCGGEHVTKISSLFDKIPGPVESRSHVQTPSEAFWSLLERAQAQLPADRAVQARGGR